MIARGLDKLVAGIAFAGFAVIELGSPLWTKLQLDTTAHDAAHDAASAFVRTNNRDQAYAAALEDANKGGAELHSFL